MTTKQDENPPLPTGFVMVPSDPADGDGMAQAGLDRLNGLYPGKEGWFTRYAAMEVYRAMIAARPVSQEGADEPVATVRDLGHGAFVMMKSRGYKPSDPLYAAAPRPATPEPVAEVDANGGIHPTLHGILRQLPYNTKLCVCPSAAQPPAPTRVSGLTAQMARDAAKTLGNWNGRTPTDYALKIADALDAYAAALERAR